MSEQAAARETGRSEAVEDYVRAILHTARGPRRVASTTPVASFLGVTPTSVSDMFKKLARLELVTYVPYRGVSLTPAGQLLALRLTRRHRLLVSFLAETLDVSVERISVEADLLAHHVSPELEELIAARVGDPPLGPDGDAPPAADAAPPTRTSLR
jgi:DtxR family Mn-dependent transcriptional regulator